MRRIARAQLKSIMKALPGWDWEVLSNAKNVWSIEGTNSNYKSIIYLKNGYISDHPDYDPMKLGKIFSIPLERLAKDADFQFPGLHLMIPTGQIYKARNIKDLLRALDKYEPGPERRGRIGNKGTGKKGMGPATGQSIIYMARRALKTNDENLALRTAAKSWRASRRAARTLEDYHGSDLFLVLTDKGKWTVTDEVNVYGTFGSRGRAEDFMEEWGFVPYDHSELEEDELAPDWMEGYIWEYNPTDIYR